MSRYWLVLLTILVGLVGNNASCEPNPPIASSNPEPMVARYYDRGALDTRHAYKFELIREVLEVTRAEYGNYQIEPYRLEPSSKRQPVLMQAGDRLNLIWASPGTDHAQGEITAIPIDIFHGLMGYRACLINATSHPEGLENFKTLESLQELRIGQGVHWADIDIYKNNNITPILANSFEGLFEMLSFNRFDCLALGITEISQSFREEKANYPSLAIDRSLLLFYEYPIYFYVSKKFPALAERIHLGLTKLIKNGRFDALFHKHFANDLQQLALQQRHLICLESPFQQSQKTCIKPSNKYFRTIKVAK
jgi:ABC-type amino acid transport substrate-binding protein